MKEATDATSGAEHHGSPAGMLVFQRADPRGEEKELTFSSALPDSHQDVALPQSLCPACPDPWHHQNPELPSASQAQGPGTCAWSSRRTPGEAGLLKGRCGHGAFRTRPKP